MRHFLKLSSACLLLLVAACASPPPVSDDMEADGNVNVNGKAVDNPWTRASQTSMTSVIEAASA